MLSWSENRMPLLSFRAEFILMSHFKMAAEKHHNHTESNIVYTCKRSERYVQNRKYFWTVAAILKDEFAVNSNSIYLASLQSSISPKTYDYSLTLLGCE